MAQEPYSEAHYARIEIFETNRNHMSWVNIWTLTAVLMQVVYWYTGQYRVLCLMPGMNTVAMGLMIRAEALIRRHWPLYVKLSGVTGVTPDSDSRRDVFYGNMWGLIFQLFLNVAACVQLWYEPAGPFLPLAILFAIAWLIALFEFINAGTRKVTFT